MFLLTDRFIHELFLSHFCFVSFNQSNRDTSVIAACIDAHNENEIANMCNVYTRRTPNSCHDFKLHTTYKCNGNLFLFFSLLTILIMIWYESRLRMQICCNCVQNTFNNCSSNIWNCVHWMPNDFHVFTTVFGYFNNKWTKMLSVPAIGRNAIVLNVTCFFGFYFVACECSRMHAFTTTQRIWKRMQRKKRNQGRGLL